MVHIGISELSNCFTSQAAQNLLKESQNDRDDDDAITCTITDSSVDDELANCFTSHTARALLKGTHQHGKYNDCSKDSNLYGTDLLLSDDDIEGQVTELCESVRNHETTESFFDHSMSSRNEAQNLISEEDEPETLWDVSEREPREIVTKKKKKKKKHSRRERRHREQGESKKESSYDTAELKSVKTLGIQDLQKPTKASSPKDPQLFVPDVNPETESRTQEHLRDVKTAQKRLDALQGSTDTRDHVELWHEKRYCHRMFRHRAQVTCPQQTCIELWEKPEQASFSKTFAQMHDGAQSMARWITAACGGTTKDKVICIYLPRGYELMSSVIGTWYAGAVVNVTDTKLPFERVEFIAGDASAAIVITTESLVSENHNMPCPILSADAVLADGTDKDKSASIWLSDKGLPEGSVVPELHEVLDENIDDDDCCVCIYTSGSTGE